jgi:hypothetical protein
MATINTTDPKPGFVYDLDTDTWFPLLGLATQSLDGLTDVVITTPSTGQILAYNGTDWINQTETGDISAVSSGTGITVTNGTGPVPTVAIDSTVATLTGSQTLTTKTIALGSNTISGTTAEFNTANTDGDFATLAGSETFTNKTLTAPVLNQSILNQPVLVSPEERINIVASAATGTVALDALTAGTMLYTSNATGNWTLNIRGSGSTSLDSILTTGDSITVVFLATQGSTAYYSTVYQIDGSAVTPKWQGGTAPAAGNASGIDAYVFNIIKTASATFTVLASQTKFA